MAETVCFSRFRGEDDTASFARAMEYLRSHPGTTLLVEPGEYLLTSELARETQKHVMNGDFGGNPQRIMFHPSFSYTRGISLDGQKGTTILARGVTLLVDGFMEPISVVNCEDVELVGLTVDHRRKPYTRGIITEINESDEPDAAEAVITLDEPVTEGTPMTLRTVFYDPELDRYSCEDFRPVGLSDGTHYHIRIARDAALRIGTEFYTVHTYHSRPAILIENAKNVRLTDVTIHSQPGMGVVGNRSENVTLTRLSVVPSCGQHWSTNTDATHFTAMTGTLRLENCTFEGQGDDFTNIHGYFQEVVEREAPAIGWIREKTPDGTHAQTLDYPDAGDMLELTSHASLQTVDSFRVLESTPDPENWRCRVVLDHPLPEDTEGWMLADVTRLPRVEIIGCHASSHYARSVLVKVREALIEGNTFRNVQGPAIVAAAESWWYEGVCPAHIIIRGNRIVNCGWRWGEAAGIVVKADSDQPAGQSLFDITVEDNLIDAPHASAGIFCRNVDGLRIRRNRIHVSGQPVRIEDCANVERDDG